MQKSRPSKTDPALVTGRLNVNDFVAARKEDIRLLERLVASAGTKSKKRAFQSLPRTERRRAASHDAKRVPRRHGLRKRAELENLHANAGKLKTTSRPKPPAKAPRLLDLAAINKKAELPADGFGVRFADRQRDKIWLPTHIWHKKRAFVEQLGRYMVPVTATQKQYRRTHRLLANKDEPGLMAWDTSFYATLVVHSGAPSSAFDQALEPVLPGVTAPLYKNRSKHWQGLFNQSGPVVIRWIDSETLAATCHPLLFDAIWDFFTSISVPSAPLTLQDARYAVGSIDLLGSNALAVLADTLIPAPDPANDAVAPHWESLASLESTDILPSRTVFEYLACDPRLFGKRFKRHNTKSEFANSIEFSPLQHVQGSVYDPESRQASLRALVKQSEVDARKKEAVTFLPDADAKIPVSVFILDDGRIRILLPRAWVLPTWLTIFTRRNAMIGGQKELHQLAFERQCPFYPLDFAGTALSSQPEAGVPRTHSHRNKEISNPLKVSSLQPMLSKMNLRPARVMAVGRGTPEPGSAVYAVPKSEVQCWLDAPSRAPVTSNPETSLLGILTSGGFNLVKAKGAGLGLLETPAEHCSSKYCLLESEKQGLRRLAEFDFLSPNECAAVL